MQKFKYSIYFRNIKSLLKLADNLFCNLKKIQNILKASFFLNLNS